MGINRCNSGVRYELLCIKHSMSSCTYSSLKFRKTLISLLTGKIKGDVIWWCSGATLWLEKYWSNLDADILVATNTGERTDIAWHHNLWDLMLGASCGLEVSETVLTKWRKSEETEEVIASGSWNDVSNSGILMEPVMMEFKPSLKPATAWSRKE